MSGVSERNVADEVYREKQNDVKVLLGQLGELVEGHGAQQAERPFSWGFVGDLAHVEERLKEVVGFLRPVDYYRGNPRVLHERRRRKLSQARHRRKQINLGLRQRTLSYEDPETVSSN